MGGQMSMPITFEFILQILLIGAGATIVMDVWLLLLKRAGAPAMNFALLGRWVGHLKRGAWTHAAIANATPIKHEIALGWSVHYAIGIVFAALLLLVEGVEW